MKKLIAVLLICLMLLLTSTSLVLATPGSWTSHMFVNNISGISDGYSMKMVNIIGDNVTWGAHIRTYTDNPPISLAMGWNSFSATEKCGTTVKQNVQGTPLYINTTDRADTIFVTKMNCGGTRYGLSNGKHIMSSSGGTNYYDTWTQTETVP
jgi:hypothetical protein